MIKNGFLWGCLLVLLFPTTTLLAQEDTVVLQLVEFSDGLDNRRAWRIFPKPGDSYRKILMYHTLKCDPTLISNPTGSGCGEWDAGANFVIRRHINKDSLRYKVGRVYPDSFLVSSTPSYTYHREHQKYLIITNTQSETGYVPATGSATLDHPFSTARHSGRAQYLYRASELLAQNMQAGDIHKLRIPISALGASLKKFTIRMRHTSLDSLTSTQYELEGLETVYRKNTAFSTTGTQTIELTTPFNWDGTSNIVVDFAFTNDGASNSYSVDGHQTSFPSSVHTIDEDASYAFDGNDFIDLDTAINKEFSTAISISFWMKGNSRYALNNRRIMVNAIYEEDYSTDRNKVLIQLPHNNGNVNWHAGYDQNSDNVSDGPVADTAIFDRWNHWAFTKDANTGELKIYHNGQLLTSATGKTQLLNNIAHFRIGNWSQDNKDEGFHGLMNELRIWNKAIDVNTINDWMYRQVDASHPDYNNLIGYYSFDQQTASHVLDEGGKYDGALIGIPQQIYTPGEDRRVNLQAGNERPNLEFVQGIYTSRVDSTLVTDTVQNEPRTIVVSRLEREVTKVGMQDVYLDTVYAWAEEFTYTYDAQGNRIDSTFHSGNKTYVNWYDESNFSPVKYITPYGNYLDLGDGFTWIYDLTDYEPLFHDTIDFEGGDHRELLDWKFVFIKGTPPRDVLQVDEVYTAGSPYEDIVKQPVGSVITPNPQAQMFKVRAMVTGHKFNNPTNCAEFCFRKHHLQIDGNMTHQWLNFTECATNPLYPQGGTWIYDRAGWCPGAPATVRHLDITEHITPGKDVLVEYGVEPDPTGTEYGGWSIQTHFIGYDLPNFNLDGEMLNIIAPNDWEYYGRMNPICANPKVVIRNSGAKTLTRVKIEYGTEGVVMRTFDWNGRLAFMETDTVLLPTYSDFMWNGVDSIGQFVARVVSVNDASDEHSANDILKTKFKKVPAYSNDMVLSMRTNNAPDETSWIIRNHLGEVKYQSEASLNANTQYHDTLQLEDGCYTLHVVDNGDDGLSFWNNNDGAGTLFLRALDGSFQKGFDTDFGRDIYHQFTVGFLNNIGIDELQTEAFLRVYPNPTKGGFYLETNGLEGSQLHLTVINNLGKIVHQERWNNTNTFQSRLIELSHATPGIYKVMVQGDQEIRHSSLVIQR